MRPLALCAIALLLAACAPSSPVVRRATIPLVSGSTGSTGTVSAGVSGVGASGSGGAITKHAFGLRSGSLGATLREGAFEYTPATRMTAVRQGDAIAMSIVPTDDVFRFLAQSGGRVTVTYVMQEETSLPLALSVETSVPLPPSLVTLAP
jgi:hypothetical protein